MFCSNCGKQVADGAYSCPFCGTVFDSSLQNQPAKTVQQQPASSMFLNTEQQTVQKPFASPQTTQPSINHGHPYLSSSR